MSALTCMVAAMSPRRLKVVPDSDRLEQALIDAAAVSDFVDASGVCTLGQLVEKCEPARWAGVAPAEPLQVRAMIALHAAELAENAFGAAARSAELAANVQELIAHLRTQAVTPQQLSHAAAQASGTLRARAQAIASLWERLDHELRAKGLVDRGDLVRLATERLASGLPPRLRGLAEIAVHHVHELSPARLAFLEALARACHAAQVRFELVWPSSNHAHTDVFVLNAIRQVEARWQSLDAEVFPEVPAAPLAWVAAAAFDDAVEPRPAPQLSAFSAPTARDEAKLIARRVKALISDGVAPELICITFRDLAADTEALVEALSELNVPARARLGVPLLASPVGRLAVALLHLVEDDFPADDVAAVLESRYSTLLPEGAAEPRRAFAEAGVRDDVVGAADGRGGFDVRLSALGKRVDPRRFEELAALKPGVQQLLAVCRSIPAEATALELLEAWWEAISRAGLVKSLRALESSAEGGLLAREVDRAFARDQSSGDALLGLLTSMKQAFVASGVHGEKLTRRELLRWVQGAAKDINLQARGPRTGAVWILDARELAGRHFEHVFLGGVVDGRFPGRAAPMPLLSEDERGTLNQLAKAPLFRVIVSDGDVRLPARLAEDRLLFHLALCAGEKSVTVSRSRVDEAGREQLASPFRDALARCVAGFEEEAISRAPAAPLDAVHSEAELRARVALEVLCAPATRQAPQDRRREALREAMTGEAWLDEARSLGAMETERLQFFSDPKRLVSDFSGRVAGAALAQVAPWLEFPKDRPLSAAELNAWGQCSFRGLSTFVLGLRSVDAVGEEPDSRARGTFLHEVLGRLVPQLQREGLLGKPDAPPAKVREHVDRAVAEAAGTTQERMPVGHPAIWKLSQQRTTTVIRRLVGAPEVLLPFEGTTPHAMEERFGDAKAKPELQAVVIPARLEGEQDVYLKGRIDRIDVAGTLAGVVDYKTTLPQNRDLSASMLISDFQIPFYLLAVQALLPDRSLAAAWIGIRTRVRRTIDEVLRSLGGSMQGLLATDVETRRAQAMAGTPNLANSVHALLGKLRGGDFGARPLECKWCDFKAVCRISERRLAVEGEP